MTYTEPKERNPWMYAFYGMLGAVVVMAVIAFLGFNSTPTVAEPRIDQDFTDRNQTRAELVDIIQQQRAATYSSYALEHAFCKGKSDEVKESSRSNISVEGQVIKVAVHCTSLENQQTITYLLEFDQINNEYKESVKVQLPTG